MNVYGLDLYHVSKSPIFGPFPLPRYLGGLHLPLTCKTFEDSSILVEIHLLLFP